LASLVVGDPKLLAKLTDLAVVTLVPCLALSQAVSVFLVSRPA